MTRTRRDYLVMVGSAATVGLAGCLGSGDTEGDDPPQESGGDNQIQTSYDCDLSERDPVSELPPPVDGPNDAAVTVDVFEDFACPHCAAFATGALVQLKDEYLETGDVRFRHFDLPIPVSEWSRRVGNAARSVQDANGDDAFFEFSVAAYENQDGYSWQLLGDLAGEVGADSCRVLSDASNGTYGQVLDSNRQTGVERGIEATPGITVNGTLVDPSESDGRYEAVSSAIDANL
jgi:protein-disulfide isomerase